MKRKIWLPKDLIGSRNPTDSEHRAIYSFMQKEYQQKKKRTYTISLILAAIGSILLIIGMLANKNVPLLLISVLFLALGLVEAMTAHAYYIREQVFRDGKYQVVDGHIYNTTKSEKTGGILAGFLSDFGDLLLPLDFPVAGSTVVGDQVFLVFSDVLETNFCRIFTASMLTKGE